MLEFKRLGFDDGENLREYFLRDNKRLSNDESEIICDRVFGTTFLWREFYNIRFCICDESLVLMTTMGDTDMFSLPIGNDPENALRQIRSYARKKEIPLYFCFVSDHDIAYFHSVFDDVYIYEEEDWFDYVYDKSLITDYPGRKYHGQKNALNRFRKSYPEANFVTLNGDNVSLVGDYVRGWYDRYSDHAEMSEAEQRAIFELLANWDDLKMHGGFAVADDKVVGFTAGEILGNTVYVHFEKAEHEIFGAYQYLSSEFLRSITAPEVCFVNREEDMGIAGLRNAKKALHPVKMLKKYTVYCK